MQRHRLVATVTCVLALSAAAPAGVFAQAFTPPSGVGAITLSWQFVDNMGHRDRDGVTRPVGQSQTTSALGEFEYGITDRLAASVGVPYVLAKYTGAMPPPSRLPVDTCGCWHSSFQDLAASVRYRLGSENLAVTPNFRYGTPSHNYPYEGEAVVGRYLTEAQIGVAAALRLTRVLPKASVGGGYSYAFVERAIKTLKNDRSNAYVEMGYALSRSLYVSGNGTWQRTHGGLHGPSFNRGLPPEFNTPQLFPQRDRLIRSNYWHVGGGAAYSLGKVDVFASYTKYVAGTDTHNGQAVTVGTTWYFDLKR